MLSHLTSIVLLWGAITAYKAPADAPMRCGGTFAPLDSIAVDIDALPGWGCGDRVIVYENAQVYHFVIRDSGYLSPFCVVQPGGECWPIIADVPWQHRWFPGLSTGPARVVNASLARRLMEVER